MRGLNESAYTLVWIPCLFHALIHSDSSSCPCRCTHRRSGFEYRTLLYQHVLLGERSFSEESRDLLHLLVRWSDHRGCSELPETHSATYLLTERRQKQDVGTGMANEVHFVTHLLDFEDALSKLRSPLSDVLTMGYTLWKDAVQQTSR